MSDRSLINFMMFADQYSLHTQIKENDSTGNIYPIYIACHVSQLYHLIILGPRECLTLLWEVENKAKFIILPIGEIHIGRMAPLVIFALWFGYISQHGGGFYLLWMITTSLHDCQGERRKTIT
jgi:hypothetical protein